MTICIDGKEVRDIPECEGIGSGVANYTFGASSSSSLVSSCITAFFLFSVEGRVGSGTIIFIMLALCCSSSLVKTIISKMTNKGDYEKCMEGAPDCKKK